MQKIRKEMIGKKFKRDKYGLSDWTDEVKEVKVLWNTISTATLISEEDDDLLSKPIIYIVGSIHTYPLDELIFVL